MLFKLSGGSSFDKSPLIALDHSEYYRGQEMSGLLWRM
jgi:hypothetical protein